MGSTIEIDGPDGAVPTEVLGPDDPSGGPALVVVPSIFGPAADLLERLRPLADRALVAVPDPFWRDGRGALTYDRIDEAFGRLADFDFARCAAELSMVVRHARTSTNGRVVALGICFGGSFVLRLAAAGAVDGVVTWHGSRMEAVLDRAGDITCPVRHHLGDADPITPPEVIEAIRSAFAGHPDAEVIVHEGASHGFSHDGDAWDPAAFEAGYASLVELLHPDTTGDDP